MYGFLCFLTVTFWFLASYQSQFMLVIWKCQWAKWAHSVIATTKNVKKVKKMDVEQVKVNVRWKAPLLLEVLPEAWLVHIQALHFSHVPYEAWSHQHHQHLCIYTYIHYIHIYTQQYSVGFIKSHHVSNSPPQHYVTVNNSPAEKLVWCNLFYPSKISQTF